MSEWASKSLGELCDDLTVGHVGSMASEYVLSGIPFLRSQNVRRGRLDLDGLKFISSEFHQKLKKSRLMSGDIVIVRTGEPGAAALISDDLGELNCSDLVIARPGKNVDPRFLCYSINCTAEAYISAHLVGAVQQHFNVGSARNLQISLPPLAEQQAIAAVIASLDDKIAVNDRIANAAYKLAQAHLARAYETAGLAKLSDIAEITMGSSPPGESYNEDGIGIPFYQGTRDFGDRFPGLRVWCTSPLRTASPGSCLVSVRAPVGRVNIARELCCIGRGVATVQSKHGTPSVLFHELSAAKDIWLPFESEGTVFGAINKQQLANISIKALDPESALALDELIGPLDRRVAVACDENKALIALRDTLLPKLMSGVIRVRYAEMVVEDVT
jgi:type I restriction enzyme, S subunit